MHGRCWAVACLGALLAGCGGGGSTTTANPQFRSFPAPILPAYVFQTLQNSSSGSQSPSGTGAAVVLEVVPGAMSQAASQSQTFNQAANLLAAANAGYPAQGGLTWQFDFDQARCTVQVLQSSSNRYVYSVRATGTINNQAVANQQVLSGVLQKTVRDGTDAWSLELNGEMPGLPAFQGTVFEFDDGTFEFFLGYEIAGRSVSSVWLSSAAGYGLTHLLGLNPDGDDLLLDGALRPDGTATFAGYCEQDGLLAIVNLDTDAFGASASGLAFAGTACSSSIVANANFQW